MNETFFTAMRHATSLARASDPIAATRVIQDALSGASRSPESEGAQPGVKPAPDRQESKPFRIDPNAEIIEPEPVETSRRLDALDADQFSSRLRKPLGEVLRVLRAGRRAADDVPKVANPSIPRPAAGAQFSWRSFSSPDGTRRYKLYIPASASTRPRGLVVMLHGCKQDPDDFAAGTNMNAVAEANGLLVAYPEQTRSDNGSCCWNWFRPSDQARGSGEPSIIAGITRATMQEFGLDRSRVFVAGLSAGGAMAAVMAETYPDLYAAVGIHSGLPYGAANDVLSAFSVMRGEKGISHRKSAVKGSALPRTIVFQGSADRTVHRSNADRIVADIIPHDRVAASEKQSGRSSGGRTFTRTIVQDDKGAASVEYWLIDGAGHAWAGGQLGGSFTDHSGPDASSEMVRFFLEGGSR